MEPFYQEWGAGEYDVEFFEMTDKSFDTDALMSAYAAEYNETFPAISVDGNSLATVQPYKNGTFGQWFGTPTFIVIAPDGTVQYGISGQGNQATINAIDAALAATGALKPNQIPLAPDFTITDSHGQLHSLYADYLDQGKTVLLEIFNTTCAPCNEIAPLLEPFYQEWGAGAFDVEFIGLSDNAFDTDALINAYQAMHNETFIAAGNDGGSVQAVAPYKNGQFGPWVDAPTFIVISPDGTVQYDVDGPTDAATIAAIDSAIVSTGAVKPDPAEQPVVVSGQVHFFNGSTGVGNAVVQVVNSIGTIIMSDTTTANGSFGLEIFLSEIQPGWEVKVIKHGDAGNGLNVLDLLRIQKHILFLETLSDPHARLAADVNNSFTITSLDIISTLKILLGQSMNFPNGETWKIFPADTDFGPPSNNAPLISTYSIPLQDILDGVRQPLFSGVKIGDVNGSADPGQ
jgi:thiol-disulfide isomerase/thioredoxin